MYVRYELHIIHVLPPCLLRMSIQNCTTSLFSFGVSLYIVPCSDSMFSDLCHPAATANAQGLLLLPCSAFGRNSVVIPIAAFAALGATSLFGHDDLVDLRVAGWPPKRSIFFWMVLVLQCKYRRIHWTYIHVTSMSSCVIQAPILHPRAFACARKCPPKNITNLSKSWNLANLWTPQALTDPGRGPTNIIKHPSLLSHFTDAHPVLDGPSRRWALHQGWSGWPNALSPYDLRCPSPLHYTPHLHARPTKQIVSVAVHTTEISREQWKSDFIQD